MASPSRLAIAHLIYHGSTKQNLDDNSGRFGSGFISTHLINREVRVRGLLADSAHSRSTLFFLEQGRAHAELSAAMDRILGSAPGVTGRNSFPLDAPATTEFAYEVIDDPTRELVDRGIAELVTCAPFVLAFNFQFSAIEKSERIPNHEDIQAGRTPASAAKSLKCWKIPLTAPFAVTWPSLSTTTRR